MANAWAQFTNLSAISQAAGQEEIEANTPIPNLLENRVESGGNTSRRVVSAGLLTLFLAVAIIGLAWAVGSMTGVALFNKVESAVV